MPAEIRVVPEDLQVAAAKVDVVADILKAKHATADELVETSQRGLPKASAVALDGALSKWQADSGRLFAQLVSHATALRESAAAYISTDQTSEADIDAAGARIRPEDMNL